eukprot:scaffold1537_cov108-Cylindrotheca_fusiformis.AAC.4
MFSSISKLMSPKSLLASYLSKSLAEFFCVDPEQVEANLVHDAKVVLNDIQLKEKCLGGRLLVSGSVGRIEFSWAWAKASLITDVKLTVQRVSIRVSLVPDEGINQSPTMAEVEVPSAAMSEAPPNSDWKANYLQQIVDHLTLVIEDINIAIQLDSGAQVIVEAIDMELQTLQSVQQGTAEDIARSLMQKLRLASIEARIVDDATASNLPILEPFGYTANVQRISGRRFLDGILSGLMVQGHSSWNDDSAASHASSTIRVHAGIHQISGLNRLQQMLLLLGSQDNNATNEGIETPSAPPPSTNVSEGVTSIFRFPFESMEVVLENDTNLRLAECEIRYCTDGTELALESTGGIWMDGVPVSKNNNRLLADFVSSELTLDSLSSSSSVSSIVEQKNAEVFYNAQDTEGGSSDEQEKEKGSELVLSVDMIQKLCGGVQAISSHCEEAMAIAEKAIQQQYPSAATSVSPRWTLGSTGIISLEVRGKSDWVRVIADAPKLTQGDLITKSSVLLTCLNVRVESSADFSVAIPEVRTENAVLIVKEPMAVELGSIDSLSSLQKLWDEVWGAVGTQSLSNSSGGELPMDVSVVAANVSVNRPNMGTIMISDIQGTGSKWKLSALEIQDVLDISAKAQCLEASLGADETSVGIEKVTMLSHQKINYLMSPILKTTLLLDKKGISLVCQDLRVKVPTGTTDFSSNKVPNVPVDNRRGGLLPTSLPLNLRSDQFSLSFGEKLMAAEAVDIWVRAANCISVDIAVKQVSGSIGHRIRGACSGIQSSLKFEDETDEKKSLVTIPGIGKLNTATTNVGDISSLVLSGIGYLAPTSDVCVTVDEQGVIRFQGKTIRFCCSDVESKAVEEPSDGSIDTSLPVSLCFKIERLLVMPELGAYKPGLCFDGLEFNVIPRNAVVRVDGTCNFFRGRAPNQATTVIKGMKFFAEKCQTDTATEMMFGLQEAGISIKEISALRIPGLLSLSKPVLDSTLQLRNNVANATFNTIHVSCSDDATDMAANDNNEAKSQETASFAQIPMDFNLSVSQVVLDFPESGGDADAPLPSLRVSLLSIEHEKPSVLGETSSLDVKCGSLIGVSGLSRCVLNRASSSIKWKSCGDTMPTDGSIYLAYVGSVSSALLEVDEVTECCVDEKYYLSQPLLNTSISYSGRVCSASIDALVLKILHSNTWTSPVESNQISYAPDSFALPSNFSWVIDARHVMLEPNATSGDIGVTLNKVSLKATLPSCGAKGSLYVACVDFRAQNPKNLGVVGKDIVTNLCLEHSPADSEKGIFLPGFGLVTEGETKVSLVSMLALPGLGNISQDLIGTNLAYGAKGFRVTLGCFVWEFNQTDTSGAGETASSSQSLDPWLFQYPIEIAAQSLEVKDPFGSTLSCGEAFAEISLDPFDSMLRSHVQLNSIFANRSDGARIVASASHLTATIRLDEKDCSMMHDCIMIPSVGHLHSAQCEVSELSDIVLPKYFSLQNPMRTVVCRFERGLISLTCAHVCLERVVSKPVSVRNTSEQSTFDLPCRVNLVVELLKISSESDQTNAFPTMEEITCTSLNLGLEPALAKVGASTESPGAAVYFKCKELGRKEGSTVMHVINLSASGLIQFKAIDTIGNLVVGVDKAQLHADFSSVNWTGSLEKDPLTVLHLPFAAVPKFELTLKYAGKLVSIRDARISCDDFEGGAKTTLDEVVAHYVAIVKGRIPYLLSKTSIIGADIGDSAGVMAGTILTKTSVVGATVGVASRDAVGAALNRGKAARGVTASEKYKFGNSARKSGSQRRGSDRYRVGDFTSGTASAAGSYASENRERLAGAGGSAFGMVAGAALLGPVGFVAGSFLGSSAAQSSVRAVSGNSKGNKKAIADSTPQSSASTIQEDAPQGQIPDLLSANDSTTPSSASTIHGDTPRDHFPDLLSATPETGRTAFSPPSPNLINGSTCNASNAPSLDAEAQMIGEVAASDSRTVMVQAQLFDPPTASSRLGAMNRQVDEHNVQAVLNSESVSSAQTHSRLHTTSSNPATVRLDGQTRQHPMAYDSHPLSSASGSYPFAEAAPIPRHQQVTNVRSQAEHRLNNDQGLGLHARGNPGHPAYAGRAMQQQQNQHGRHTQQQTSSLGRSQQQDAGAQQGGYRFGKCRRNPSRICCQRKRLLKSSFHFLQVTFHEELLLEAGKWMEETKTVATNS